MDHPIQVEGLRKSYGSVVAVRSIDFEVRPGEVFGLLGPNGAGKTTTVEILEGLRQRDGGRVSVLGCDPEKHTRKLKDRIGVCLQATRLPDKIKVREVLELFAALYTRTVDRVPLLKRLELWEKREALYHTLSGGQKQRLALALALLNDPQLLFLDEPSAGLDPQARLEIRDLVMDLRSEQRAIVLTTHYIEEAERLCDRVAIVDQGRIIAMGPPREIQERASAESLIEIECAAPLDGIFGVENAFRFSGEQAREALRLDWRDAEWISLDEPTRMSVASRRPARSLVDVMKWLDENGVEPADIRIRRPSLEDAFIELTGKSLRE